MLGNRTDRQFFIKLHRASHLHYDFRLEHDGVLKSWVILPGPSLDPTEHRLAVFVNDHAVEYGSIERVIPAGQYGAGPVLLWDHGIWQPCQQNVDQAIHDGLLKFQLLGFKLKGVWSLKRIPVRNGVRGKNWLLIKEQDEEARPLSEMDILEKSKSVLTDRTLDEVAAEPHRFESLKRKKNGGQSAAGTIATSAAVGSTESSPS